MAPRRRLAHVAHRLQLSNTMLAIKYVTPREEIQRMFRSTTAGSCMLAGSLNAKAGQVGEGKLSTFLNATLYQPLFLIALNCSVEQTEHVLQAGVVRGLLSHRGRLLDRRQRLFRVTKAGVECGKIESGVAEAFVDFLWT